MGQRQGTGIRCSAALLGQQLLCPQGQLEDMACTALMFRLPADPGAAGEEH